MVGTDSDCTDGILPFRERRRGGIHQPLFIKEAEVERVTSFKFLGITEDLTWTINITDLAAKARQRLDLLRKLRKSVTSVGAQSRALLLRA